MSQVNLDGDIKFYQHDELPLRDIDTIGAQIRQYTFQGLKEFELARQATDKVEEYQYRQLDKKTIETKKWGTLNVLPIRQSGADEITYYLAPELDYQMVQATYHGVLLNGTAQLTDYTSSCG
ncbi:hypothetical protein [Vibrio mexicanus]|uniref:hypothetical protein n=1 Tax=Vibrio mexicanus TaxID=1004326 RepID=UPI00069C53F4|nr:hypothetical protein [Vibrio mexicanus]